MKIRSLLPAVILVLLAFTAFADDEEQLQQQIKLLKEQSATMQTQLNQLQQKIAHRSPKSKSASNTHKIQPAKSLPAPVGSEAKAPDKNVNVPSNNQSATQIANPSPPQTSSCQLDQPFHNSMVSVHSVNDADPESIDFYPTALVADKHVFAYIAGTPVVSSPYLGSRPAFDGSDYIVNISSINRDVRLMQQRRSLNRAYEKMGYPLPNRPILAISGKVEPIGTIGQPYFGPYRGDWNLGSDELDLAAILNNKVEAYMGLAYNAAPPSGNGQRVANSSLGLNMGFVNIGDLDVSPIYLTAGQLFAPFGRYSTSMVSPTLPMMLTRIKARPIILGYKSQTSTGIFAAIYGFRGDTILGTTAVGGANLGYILDAFRSTTEIGVSFVSSLNDAGGMQNTGAVPGTTFGGFASFTNGSEYVHKIPGIDAHLTTSFDRYNITLEWASSLGRFQASDLSFNGQGAQPQAAQIEGGITFFSFDRPSSIAVAYQLAYQTLALNIPHQRMNVVYNISIWKDTVESLEYRHDIDYGHNQFANGIAPPGLVNQTTYGTGGKADTLMAQIGIYF